MPTPFPWPATSPAALIDAPARAALLNARSGFLPVLAPAVLGAGLVAIASTAGAGVDRSDFLESEGNHAIWRRCAEAWPSTALFWIGAIKSTPFGSPPFSVAALNGVDGGVTIADRLLEIDVAPSADLLEVILKQQPSRLVELLSRPMLSDVEAVKLALPRIEKPPRSFTSAEWDALGIAALRYALSAGHLQLAAETWLTLPPDCRARLGRRPLSRVSFELRSKGEEVVEESGDQRPLLALALANIGKLDEARRIPRVEGPARREAFETDVSAFSAFIVHGVPTDVWEAALEASQQRIPFELLPLVLDFVAPYEDMLANQVKWFLEDTREDREALPADLQRRLAAHREAARVKLAARAKGLLVNAATVDAGTVALPQPPWPWKETKPSGTRNPDTAQPRIRGFWPVRWERQGKRTVVLAASQRLDPTGEVSQGGFWLLISTKAGPWKEVYLGFSDHRPFTPRTLSRVPLIDAKDVVRVEVDEAPLDDRSITFPPIAMRAETKRSGVVLQSTLGELTQDSDADGLSDLVEARLLMNPKSSDTDGDGLLDAVDPTPRLDDRLPPTVKAEALNAFFESSAERRKPAAIVLSPGKQGLDAAIGPFRQVDLDDVRWLVGTPDVLGGLQPLTRVVTVSQAELEAVQMMFGLSFPMYLTVHASKDGKHALIVWSESWRGGAARLDKDEKGVWKVEVILSWVT